MESSTGGHNVTNLTMNVVLFGGNQWVDSNARDGGEEGVDGNVSAEKGVHSSKTVGGDGGVVWHGVHRKMGDRIEVGRRGGRTRWENGRGSSVRSKLLEKLMKLNQK